eukprot:scaffold59997_cov51-Phaeocystis_antarctica.AAC.1
MASSLASRSSTLNTSNSRCMASSSAEHPQVSGGGDSTWHRQVTLGPKTSHPHVRSLKGDPQVPKMARVANRAFARLRAARGRIDVRRGTPRGDANEATRGDGGLSAGAEKARVANRANVVRRAARREDGVELGCAATAVEG